MDRELLFCASKGQAISDMTMTKVLRDDKIPSVTVHGFRNSFTDWAAETTDFLKEVFQRSGTGIRIWVADVAITPEGATVTGITVNRDHKQYA